MPSPSFHLVVNSHNYNLLAESIAVLHLFSSHQPSSSALFFLSPCKHRLSPHHQLSLPELAKYLQCYSKDKPTFSYLLYQNQKPHTETSQLYSPYRFSATQQLQWPTLGKTRGPEAGKKGIIDPFPGPPHASQCHSDKRGRMPSLKVIGVGLLRLSSTFGKGPLPKPPWQLPRIIPRRVTPGSSVTAAIFTSPAGPTCGLQ